MQNRMTDESKGSKVSSKHILSNMLYRFAERTGAQAVQIIVSIVLARMIMPEDFGTIAMVVVIADIFQVFVDSGLGNALIQKKEADDLDFSSVFYFNICWCLCLYGLIWIISPYIAAFYGNDLLVPVIRVLCISVIISGLKNVQQAYVSRTMQFRKFFWATLAGTIASAFAGIVAAASGMGVWALVVQRLANMAIDTLILWFTVGWHPKLCFSLKRLSALIGFGWKLLASSLLDTLYNNLRKLIIGKLYTGTDLAYYNQGEQIPQILITNINRSIDSVLLPIMSKEQDNRDKVREMTRKSIKTSMYLLAPMMIGLFVVAPVLVRIFLTDKWLPCVPYLRIFCIEYMFWPIHTANLVAITALGRSDIYFNLEIVKKIIGVIVLVVSVGLGVRAIAYGVLLTGILCQLINAAPNRRLISYGYISQVKDCISNICMAVIMGICVYLVSYTGLSMEFQLATQFFVGIAVYTVLSVLSKNTTFLYLVSIAKTFLYKHQSSTRGR